MWVVNPEKENTKSWLLTDIQSHITNLQAEANNVTSQLSNGQRLLAGSVVGADEKLYADYQRTLTEISEALTDLHYALDEARELDIYEWEDDYDDYY